MGEREPRRVPYAALSAALLVALLAVLAASGPAARADHLSDARALLRLAAQRRDSGYSPA